MKKIFIALVSALCCAGSFAQVTVTKTETKTETTTVTGTETKVETKVESKVDTVYMNSNKSVFLDGMKLALGWNFALNTPEFMDKANGHSVFVAWDLADVNFKLGSDRHLFSVGLGMIWNKYSISENGYFEKNNGSVAVYESKGENKVDYSRYLTYSLTVPVAYTYQAKNGLFVSAGPVVNFNLYSSIYNEVGNDNVTTKSVYHNPVTVDLRMMLGYKHCGLMFKYSPMQVIQSGKGPDFNSWGVGIFIQ